MTETKFDLIEYRGFKDVFFGLGCGEGKYYMLYGKTGTPSFKVEDESTDIVWHYTKISSYVTERNCTLNIPFVPNTNNILFNIITIDNRAEYDRIIKIFGELLYDR